MDDLTTTTSSLLRCECRRPPAFERGLVKWSFALLIIGAAALDAFWVMPAERDAETRARAMDPFIRRCVDERALVPASPELAGELRVDDVQLLTPTQAVR